ncbi:hypothetical protein OAG24_00840 [bacterium]|nr:hypothetical protein [bacterium]
MSRSPKTPGLILFLEDNKYIKDYIYSYLLPEEASKLALVNSFFLELDKKSHILYKIIKGEIDFKKTKINFDVTYKNYLYLYLSIEKGHHSNVEYLISRPEIIGASLDPKFFLSGVKTDDKIVNLLIDHGVNPSVNCSKALVTAVKSNKLSIVRTLVKDRRISLTSLHGAALKDACIYGRIKMVQSMITGRKESELPDLNKILIITKNPKIQKLLELKLSSFKS